MIDLALCPGTGAECKPITPEKVRIDKDVHLHCDAKSIVRVYMGDAEDCPDFRKARTASRLYSGSTA
jgi:hypothetical protein